MVAERVIMKGRGVRFAFSPRDPPPDMAKARKKKERAFRYLLIAASVVLLVAGLRAASGIFVPVLLAFFIATVSFPVMNFLRTRGVPRFLAVLLTVLVDFAFLTGVVLIGVSLAGDLVDKWNEKYHKLSQQKVEEASNSLVAALEGWNVPDARERVNEYFTELAKEQLSSIEVGKVWDVGTGVVGKVASFVGAAFLVIILTIFMLTEARMFGRRINAICEARGPDFERMLMAGRDVQRYMGIKTLVSLATGLFAGILCRAAGLDFYVLWGILAFALNYIPVVGSIMAGIPPVLLALLVYGGASATAVGAGFVAINVFLGNLVEPMLLGRRFGISTLVVVLAVLFWGWVWGPVGMLLAVPLTMILKVAMDNSDEFRWLAVAISKEQAVRPEEEEILKQPPQKPRKKDGEGEALSPVRGRGGGRREGVRMSFGTGLCGGNATDRFPGLG